MNRSGCSATKKSRPFSPVGSESDMNAEGLRAQAARLLAIALRAHGDGDEALADLLTKRALQYLDAIDAARVVQQQQPQPKKD